MTRASSRFALLLALAALPACADAIVFSTGTLIGLEASGGEGPEQGFKLGYQRVEYVSMPMRHENGVREQAYDTLALLALDTGAIFSPYDEPFRVTQVFATGAAATQEGSAEAARQAFVRLAALAPPEAVGHAEQLRVWLRDPPGDLDHDDVAATIGDVLAGSTELDPDEALDLVHDAVRGGRTDALRRAVDALRARLAEE